MPKSYPLGIPGPPMSCWDIIHLLLQYDPLRIFIASSAVDYKKINKSNQKNVNSKNQLISLQVGLAIPYFALLQVIRFASDGSYQTFALKCLLAKLPHFLSCIASVGHLAVISLDRSYISLVRPIQHKVLLTKKYIFTMQQMGL
jgi:hypothetical protein